MNQAESQFESQESSSENTRPIAAFSGSGGIRVAVWKNKSESGFDNYSVRVERNYKDNTDGTFKSTPYLRDSDLPRLEKLIAKADQWIEDDKAKVRASSTGKGA